LAVKILFANDGIKEVDAVGMCVGELLKKLGLLVEEYIVVVNGRVVTEDYVLRDGDEVKLYPVVSGG